MLFSFGGCRLGHNMFQEYLNGTQAVCLLFAKDVLVLGLDSIELNGRYGKNFILFFFKLFEVDQRRKFLLCE